MRYTKWMRIYEKEILITLFDNNASFREICKTFRKKLCPVWKNKKIVNVKIKLI